MPVPEQATLGSLHVLKTPDGGMAVGYHNDQGWAVFTASEVSSAAGLNAKGYEYVRELHVTRRVLVGDPPVRVR